jgi:hypothetical protein
MHTTSTWLDLAAHIKSLADKMTDPVERTAMLSVAAGYEQHAWEAVATPDFARRFGAYP